jgi:pimeloyl-ACP methyl ester carboxylesterase
MTIGATISRRTVLTAIAMSPTAVVTTQPAGARDGNRATFVLVHGAWHGGWCWKRLIPLLRAEGHECLSPTLTGLGERSHLLAPSIDLNTHIADISGVLEYEDLRRVVLVGHSYGGMVITGVAAKAASRVTQLVYLDAFLPDNGKALRDYAPLPPTRDDGWRVPPPGPPSAFGVTSADDVAWMTSRLGDHPLNTFTQPVQLAQESTGPVRRAVIHCSKAPWFVEAAERAQRRGLQYRELLEAGHDAMVTRPLELARILIGLL